MNSEGYKSPTEDLAVYREAKREQLRKRHHVKEGDSITLRLRMVDVTDPESGREKYRTVKRQVYEIHEHFIVLTNPRNGTRECYQWNDFKKMRRGGASGKSADRKRQKEGVPVELSKSKASVGASGR